MQLKDFRFALAWAMPLAIGAALLRSAPFAWAVTLVILVSVAVAEALWPRLQSSPAATANSPWFLRCLRLHVLWQGGLLALGIVVVAREGSLGHAVLAGLAVGVTTGGQGITFAHELGHSKSLADRLLGWLLMGSVNYAHFMVEHYRGHHVRVATDDDPASARAGESLWRFLPRTLAGSWRSAWQLESQRLAQHRLGWVRSPLLWATIAQAAWLVVIGSVWGSAALLFWVVQSIYAVWLLETINYVEHYGLRRAPLPSGRPEPFGMQHAWNADCLISNCLLANLQRHSDHHMHAWKPYATLEPLAGPQLPTGYAGSIWLATIPPLWFRVMHPRLKLRLQARLAA
jgi:alkane 1-monooxygenase